MAVGKRSLTVLVVEDEALLRWSIAELLRRGGYVMIEATGAHDTHNALNRTSGRIDVVILDCLLTDSNSLRFLDEVRQRLPHSAVVLMTAYDTPDMVQEAIDRGAYRVLSKPFDMYDVEALVMDAYRSSWYH